MRAYISLLSMCIVAVTAWGCSSSFSNQKNGIETYRVDHFQAPFRTSTVVTQNTQKYPNAVAEIGPMPGGQERALAEQRVFVDEVRRNNSALYGGWGGWGWGGTAFPPPSQYRVMPYMQSSPGVFYQAPPCTTMPVTSGF